MVSSEKIGETTAEPEQEKGEIIGRGPRWWAKLDMGTRHTILDNLIWPILVFVLVPLALTTPHFVTSRNLWNILGHSSILAIMVIGQSLIMLTGNIDLSAGSILAFSAMMGSWLVGMEAPASEWGVHPLLGLMAMIGIGGMIGLLNGVAVAKLKINAFIVTLATLVIFRGMALLVTKGHTILGLPDLYRAVAQVRIGPMPLIVVIAAVIFFLFHFIVTHTTFGRYVYAVGGNKESANRMGISPNRVIIRVFVISGVLAAIVGWLLTARMNAALPALANDMVFEIIAASVIGGIGLMGGRGTIVGAMGGVLLLGVIDSALNLMIISPFYVGIIRGFIIFLAAGLDALKERLL